VTAILLGALVLGERLDPNHFFGMALIGLALAAIDGRLLALGARRWRFQPNARLAAEPPASATATPGAPIANSRRASFLPG
jgi:hypothetical protein